MKIPKKVKIGHAVEIKWDDSAGTHGWMNEDDFKEDVGKASIKSVGYFLGVKEGALMVIGDRQSNDGYVTRVNRGISIPFGCVKSVRGLD